jgi:hypothetical protein
MKKEVKIEILMIAFIFVLYFVFNKYMLDFFLLSFSFMLFYSSLNSFSKRKEKIKYIKKRARLKSLINENDKDFAIFEFLENGNKCKIEVFDPIKKSHLVIEKDYNIGVLEGNYENFILLDQSSTLEPPNLEPFYSGLYLLLAITLLFFEINRYYKLV